MRWRNAFRHRGQQALHVRFSPGRPPKLLAIQRRRLVGLLLQGPLAHGYQTDLWTTRRITDVIRKNFGVRYHPDHVGRLLHQLGWTPQKPETRALQRDEQAITRWKQKDWPRIKKTPRGWAPTSSS
jgi:transposase